jgi:hypothetical protein
MDQYLEEELYTAILARARAIFGTSAKRAEAALKR